MHSIHGLKWNGTRKQELRARIIESSVTPERNLKFSRSEIHSNIFLHRQKERKKLLRKTFVIKTLNFFTSSDVGVMQKLFLYFLLDFLNF